MTIESTPLVHSGPAAWPGSGRLTGAAMARVLVVDDDHDTCELLRSGLARRGFEVETTTRAEEALEIARRANLDVIVTDVHLRNEDGIELCKQLVEARPDVPVVIMTAHGDMSMAIDAIRAGAYDFLPKPLKMQRLALTLERAVEHRALRAELRRLQEEGGRPTRPIGLIGESKAMERVFELVETLAGGDATVLVTGESGTGKELVARAIHRQSARGNGPFVAINCAAMPATLLESELFGHVKGAFTDAKNTRQGLFVQADGGTLFLDEIGEMPPEMQAKLLRVLQERTVRPVGGDREIPFDTRIIAATNRDLDEEVERGQFREDLYYRINVVRVPVPPLRSRGRDILLLAQHFLVEHANRSHKEVHGISEPAARKLLSYDWPGNVRELENCMERAVTLARLEEITVDDLSESVRDHQSSKIIISGDDPDEMPTLEEMERRYIRRVLEATRGNKSHAARVLGMDRRTLYRKLERLEIQLPS